MRALFFSAALISAALSGCVRCCIPLNAPPYDQAQWGWGPQDRFYVTRSYYGFAKDYPGVHPYRMVPPNAPVSLTAGPPQFPAPNQYLVTNQYPGPNSVVVPMGLAQASPVVASGPTAVAF
jgi:hypothetical protein